MPGRGYSLPGPSEHQNRKIMNTNTISKKARAGKRVYKDKATKITLTLTVEEWWILHKAWDTMKASRAEKEPQRAPLTWAEYVDQIRQGAVYQARRYCEKVALREEVQRARAAGFCIPDSALRLV